LPDAAPASQRCAQIIRFQRFIDDVRQLGHRHFEDFVTRHRQENRIFRITRSAFGSVNSSP
jgi:hypothetical protein